METKETMLEDISKLREKLNLKNGLLLKKNDLAVMEWLGSVAPAALALVRIREHCDIMFYTEGPNHPEPAEVYVWVADESGHNGDYYNRNTFSIPVDETICRHVRQLMVDDLMLVMIREAHAEEEKERTDRILNKAKTKHNIFVSTLNFGRSYF